MKKLICFFLGHSYEAHIDYENRGNDKLICKRCGKVHKYGQMSYSEYKEFKKNQNLD